MSYHDPISTRVWITGASQGIGHAVARELLGRGARVAVSARSEGALMELVEEFTAERCMALAMDVTDREANKAVVGQIEEAWGGLDVAFLNAGICEYVDVDEFDSTLFERTMQTNVMGTVHGVEAALPALRQSARGHLVGMSSIARYSAMPRAEAYGASKAAIAYLMDALRIDLMAEGIRVTTVNPGFVRTPLTDENDFPMPFRVEPEDAARIIADGIMAGRAVIEFPGRLAWPWKMLAAMPVSWSSRLVARWVMN